jgi:DNA-binding transcriptional MerR regulator
MLCDKAQRMSDEKKKGRVPPEQDVVWIEEGSASKANTDAMFTAEAVADRFKITVRALHFYETLGLIKPQRNGSVRIYDQFDCDRLALVTRDRRVAAALYDIGQVVQNRTRDGAAQAFALGRDKCDEQIRALEQARSEISLLLAELRRIQTILTVKLAGRGDSST